MTAVPEFLLQDIAARVAQRVAGEQLAEQSLPPRYVLLVLSGEGRLASGSISGLGSDDLPVVALADVESSARGALAAARAALPSLIVIGEDGPDTELLVTRAARVIAPSMDLALASRVASLQTDTPGARALVRALLRGVAVEATLDDRDFDVSDRASDGARQAVAGIEKRLLELGVVLGSRLAARRALPVLSIGGSTVELATGASKPHPSQEKFTLPDSVNEFVEFLERRACSMEPGKPCVDCGACEARGF